MAKIEDGGPAFPTMRQPETRHPISGDILQEAGLVREGMSLRDWFAGHAPPVPNDYISGTCPDIGSYRDRQPGDFARDFDAWDMRRRAVWSYAYADAMLAASKEPSR